MSKRHTGFFLVSYVWLLTAVSVGASPIFLVEEGFGNDILLKFEFGVLNTVGNIGFGDVRGLGYNATTDTLFGVTRSADRLLTIDRNTGAGTPVSSNFYIPPAGSNTAEISADVTGNMFGLGHVGSLTAVDTLFTVNTTTGQATAIGGLGVPVVSGLAFDHATGTLYGTTFNGALYTINSGSGAASLLGQITGSNGGVARIAFDQGIGILYGITNREQLVTVDLSTLAATQVAQFTVPNQIYSLDFVSKSSSVPIPEPSTLAVLALGLIAVGLRRRRIVVRHY